MVALATRRVPGLGYPASIPGYPGLEAVKLVNPGLKNTPAGLHSLFYME